jgi:hypothetical protein
MAASAANCNHRSVRWDSVSMNKLGPAQPLPYLCGVCSDCDLTIHASGVIENVKPAGSIGILASVFIKHWNAEKDAPPVADVLFFRDVSKPAPLPS